MFDQNKIRNLTQFYLQKIEEENDNSFIFEKLEKSYDELIEVINYHNEKYYLHSTSEISDYQYDKLFNLLKNIELESPSIIKEYSPTQKLTFQVQKEFKQASHKISMLSLENTYNAEDLRDWDQSIRKILEKKWIEDNCDYLKDLSYYIEPKYDWVSIDLVFEKWIFKQAITRWDWEIWEDVTENVKTIKSIPRVIENFKNFDEIRIRWEIVLPKSQLEKINNERIKSWEQLFANTRNAASGSIRQLDANVTAGRWLLFFPYTIETFGNNIKFNSFLELWFLKSDFLWTLSNIKDIEKIVSVCLDSNVFYSLENQDVEFDWLVVKVLDINLRNILWYTAHHPRWAVAYKFPTKQVVTKIIDVEYSVWRMWTITPVAKLETVEIGWVKVSSASLHNFDFINSKDIRLWDYVWVQRSWEVIPYVVWVVLENRDDNVKEILPPTHCPICQAEAVRFEDEAYYYCWNINCPAVIKEKLTHFVSKEWMDIDGFGDKFIELFVDAGIIKHFADIYKLNTPENKFKMKLLPWMWEKRVEDLMKNIEKSKNNPLWRIINAIWVKQVWKKTAKVFEQEIFKLIENSELRIENEVKESLLESMNDLNSLIKEINLINFNYKTLISILTNDYFLNHIYGIWPETINSLKIYLSEKENIQILSELQQQWLKFNIFEDKNSLNSLLEWTHFCITWKFELSRPKIIEILEWFGAIFDDQPLKTTNFLLVWEEWWSKLKKAQDYGVEIVNWFEELFKKYEFLKWKFDIKETAKNITNKQLWLF